MRIFSLSILATVAALAFGSSHAWAQESTTATYGAWTVRCSSVAPAAEADAEAVKPRQVCEMAQTVSLRETGQVILEIALGRLDDSDPVSMVFQVPPSVWLRANVQASLGGEVKPDADFEASYFRCTAQACLADGPLTDDFRDGLLSGEAMVVGFTDGSQKEVFLPISLEGFKPAFESLFSVEQD